MFSAVAAQMTLSGLPSGTSIDPRIARSTPARGAAGGRWRRYLETLLKMRHSSQPLNPTSGPALRMLSARGMSPNSADATAKQ